MSSQSNTYLNGPLAQAKSGAKALRKRLAGEGKEIGHSEALEQIARDQGFRDWNTFRVTIDKRQRKSWVIGEQVSGHYLAQPFTACILSSQQVRPGWFRLVLDLDEAVDVVRFVSFSNLRKQIRVTVGPKGHSKERTSDGRPHAELNL